MFRLPSWLRGSYLVRDFSKHVIGLRAWSGRKEIAVQRLDKRSFRCEAAPGPLRLEYRVYAYDDSVRKAYLDTRRGFFNGSSLFYCPEGFESSGFEVEVRKPERFAKWRLATTLLGLFSSLALAVAAIGLYAAFAHAVAEQRAEMAIRQAIGARPIGIVRMVLRESLTVAAIGAAVTAGAALLSDLALVFVGGDQFAEIADHLWIFAILGTVLSMLQLLVYSVLARQGQRSVYLVWAAFVVLIVLGLGAESLRGLLSVVIVIDSLLLAALLAISLYVTRPISTAEPAAR